MLLLVLPLPLIPITVSILHDPVSVTLAGLKLAGVSGATRPPIDTSTSHLRVRVVPFVGLAGNSSDPPAPTDDGRLRVEPGLVNLLRFLEYFDALAAWDIWLIDSDLAIVNGIFELQELGLVRAQPQNDVWWTPIVESGQLIPGFAGLWGQPSCLVPEFLQFLFVAENFIIVYLKSVKLRKETSDFVPAVDDVGGVDQQSI